MYDDLLTGIKTLLTSSALFGSVQCGLGKPTTYPAASLWLQKGTAGSGKSDPLKECMVLCQIQGYADDDTEQSYLDMVALVAAAELALHQARLPGKGAQALVWQDTEAMRMEQGGPTVYVLKIQARVASLSFSLT